MCKISETVWQSLLWATQASHWASACDISRLQGLIFWQSPENFEQKIVLKLRISYQKPLFSIGYNHIRFHWKYCPLVTSPGDIIVSPFLQMSIFSQDAGWKYWGKQEIIWVKTLARKYAQFLLFGWQILTRCFLLFPIFSRSTFSWRWCFDDVTAPAHLPGLIPSL